MVAMAEDRDDRIARTGLRRSARLASLPLGFAGRATVGLGRRLGGAPAEQVSEQLQQRAAEQLFKVLGELKGGAMKFGQALSLFEAVLPDDIAGPYREQLSRLQEAAPPMPTSRVHAVMTRELGPGWRDNFSSFSAATSTPEGVWSPENCCQSPVRFRMATTASVGWAPTPSQYCTRSESTLMIDGSFLGWY